MKKEIFVYADWKDIDGPFLMGILTASPIRGKESFSFEYDKAWLKSGKAQLIDPDWLYIPAGFTRGMTNPMSVYSSTPVRIGGEGCSRSRHIE